MPAPQKISIDQLDNEIKRKVSHDRETLGLLDEFVSLLRAKQTEIENIIES